MNDRPIPPSTPSPRPPFSIIPGGKKSGPDSNGREWQSCLARLVINASYVKPAFVNAELDEYEAPIHHYHFYSTQGFVMRVVGPHSSLKWTWGSGETEVTKLGVGCIFNPRPVRGGDSPYIQMLYEDERLDHSKPGILQEVDEHCFEAALPEKILNQIHTAITRGGITQFLVSAWFQWNPGKGQKKGWVSDDFVIFTLEGAQWYPIPEDFFH